MRSHRNLCFAHHYQLNGASVGIAVDFKQLSKAQAQLCMLCVLRALKALHAINLVHRDVRWGNLLRCVHRATASADSPVEYVKLIDLELVAKKNLVRGVSWAGVSQIVINGSIMCGTTCFIPVHHFEFKFK
jgi:serine/threonine protein kinase